MMNFGAGSPVHPAFGRPPPMMGGPPIVPPGLGNMNMNMPMGGRRMSMGGAPPMMGRGMPMVPSAMRDPRLNMGLPPMMGNGMPVPPGMGGGMQVPPGMRGRRQSMGVPPPGMMGRNFGGGGNPFLGGGFRPSRSPSRAGSPSRGRVFDPTRTARATSPTRRGSSRMSRLLSRQQSPSRSRAPDPMRPRARSLAPGVNGNQSRGRMFDPTRAARAASPGRGMARGTLKPSSDFSAPRSSDKGQRYDKVKKLKTGGMSVAIILLRGRRDGKYYVEKRVSVSDNFKAKRAQAELDTLKKVRGQKHLNQLIEHSMLGNQMSVILEYCDKESLSSKIEDALKNGGNFFQESGIWNILMCVADGLAFLHNGIHGTAKSDKGDKNWDTMCHLDLKPCNIFISSRGGEFGERRIVLADFGCVVKYSDIMSGKEDYHRQQCGTAPWYPPEGIAPMQGKKGGYGTKTDIFMLGATAHAVARLKPNVPDRLKLMSESPCGMYYSKEINAFVRKLAAHDFSNRPAARWVAVQARRVLEEIVAKKERRRPHFY